MIFGKILQKCTYGGTFFNKVLGNKVKNDERFFQRILPGISRAFCRLLMINCLQGVFDSGLANFWNGEPLAKSLSKIHYRFLNTSMCFFKKYFLTSYHNQCKSETCDE